MEVLPPATPREVPALVLAQAWVEIARGVGQHQLGDCSVFVVGGANTAREKIKQRAERDTGPAM